MPQDSIPEPAAPAIVRALEPRYYLDPACFEREKERIFFRTWQFACHESEVAAPGDYYAFTLIDQDLFCVRGKDGVIRTFHNVCQHRAHQLVSGTGSRKVLVCPYHAWSYDLEGRLKKAPNEENVPGFDRSAICLTEVRTEIFAGFVFINLDPDAKPMAEWFPDAESEVREFVPNLERLKPVEWVEIPEACNWKVAVENYSECYHCQLNHPTFARGVIKPQTYDIQPQGFCLRHTTECANLERMSYAVDLAANEHAGEYSSWFLFPTFSFQVYPGNVLNTYHWRPAGIDRVVVWRGWYTEGGLETDVITKLAQQDRWTTVEEDIRLVESVQRGLRSRGYRPGPLIIDPRCGVSSEHSLKALHSWIREALGPELS